MRRYQQSIDALNAALSLSPDDPLIYGRMAHAYAHLGRKDETLRYVEAAEKQGGDQSAILLDTGDALLTLGDQKAAMDRFARALEAPDANRVDARLAIARLMVKYGKDDDAKQQISLGFAESRIGEAPPVTADNSDRSREPCYSPCTTSISADVVLPEERAGRSVAGCSRHRTGEYLSGARQDQAGRRAAGDDRRRSRGQPELRLPDGARRGLSAAASRAGMPCWRCPRPTRWAAAISPSWRACR